MTKQTNAVVTTNLNVRVNPSKNSPRLGILPNNTKVIVISRTEDSEWLLVQSPSLQSPSSIGWVMASYVQITDTLDKIPIINADELYQATPLIDSFSPTPTSEVYKHNSGFEIAPIAQVLGRLSVASPDNIQDIAASQTALLVNYYNLGLEQARKSFNWALISAIVGFLFFIIALFLIVVRDLQNASVISLISGALVEVISGINFYLYGKSTVQLADFQSYLDRTQSILLANSICESLSDEHKHTTRADLVKIVARGENNKVIT